MNILLDTNVVISALLWRGKPRSLFDLCISGDDIRLFSSSDLIAELRHSLAYPKLTRQLTKAGSDAETVIGFYNALVHLVEPETVGRVVPSDPDDDKVVAAAIAAHAVMIVSGNRDLLELGSEAALPVLTVAEAIEVLKERKRPV